MIKLFRFAAMALFASASAAPAAAFAAAQDSTSAASKPAADGKKERVICKRQTRIGSLVAASRVCLTKKEWDRAQVVAQETARGAIDSCRNRGSGGPC
jgi:hypothetical protein